MTADGNPRIEYIEARRVLLDALVALQPHADAVILIGAQAVYLRTADRMPTYQAFTTDADLAIDPGRLAAAPLLGDALAVAGFSRSDEPGIWKKRVQRSGFDGHLDIPIDLIVPKQIASKAGSRGARLPGGHGKYSARKTEGVEGALVDNSLLKITGLEAGDPRRVCVRVAGPTALTVAKAHKLGERLDTPYRLQAKDAGDVYRLFDATSVADMAAIAKQLLADERSASTVQKALDYLRRLFATPRSPGTQLATQALSAVIDETTATTFVTAYAQELIHQIQH
ncbi:MAG: hypothetical protein KTV68_19075 [Acidimicrobiia bacterium]|nr:hypothetical protein [Acidimicrobiia bacterium]